jgi:ABC-type antimicrobial peptide transport system permease subunit
VVLVAGFAAFALILASLGIYAVISFSVRQRVQEIGIRKALGESAADLRRRIVLRTLGLAAVGLAL